MEFVTDRKEIAKKLNFMKYPVLMIDITKPKKGWDEGVYEGCKVRVDLGYEYKDTPMYANCVATIFVDNYHKGIPDTIDNRLQADIHLMAEPVGISSSFGASDVIEDAQFAMAPVVKAGQEVVVVYKWRTADNILAAVRVVKVPEKLAHFASSYVLR